MLKSFLNIPPQTNKFNFNLTVRFVYNGRHEKRRHYEGLFKLKREDGIGYPYLKAALPSRSIIKWQFFDHPELNKSQYDRNEFPVLLTKNVEGVGKKGDVVEVRRGFYRYFLLENNAAKPLTKFSDIPKHVLGRLAKPKLEIDNEQTKKDAYNQAISILSNGININFDPMAQWVITPFHLAKIVEQRTGFNVKPHHFKMESAEIRTNGTHMVEFMHENGMNLSIPINISNRLKHN